MEATYKHYDNVTREILDSVKVGDLIKVNDWKRPMKVKAVSPNYFVMTNKQFGSTFYSVVSKIPWDGIRYNSMVDGMFHCGTDNWIFGSKLCFNYENVYDFTDEKVNALYLSEFESGETELSARNAIAIYDIYIKSNLKR